MGSSHNLAGALTNTLLLAAALAACGDGGSTPAVDRARQGGFATASVQLDFVDRSRPTSPSGAFSGAPHRRLPTRVWYPTNITTPPPLLVASHNLGGSPESLEYLSTHLASHGYAVAAPTFPLTSLASSTGVAFDASDLVNQAGDVSFVIDRLLDRAQQSLPGLAAPIDGDSIGAFGVSGGAITTQLVAFHPDLHDSRIDAAAVIALPLAGIEHFAPAPALPVIYLAGSRDLFAAPAGNARTLYAEASPPRFLAEISGATHVGFIDPPGLFGSGIDANPDLGLCDLLRRLAADLPNLDCVDEGNGPPLAYSSQRELTKLVVTTFFDAFLRGDGAARSEMSNGFAPGRADELTLRSDEIRF